MTGEIIKKVKILNQQTENGKWNIIFYKNESFIILYFWINKFKNENMMLELIHNYII